MGSFADIRANYQRIRREVPDSVTIVLAAKTRTAEEIQAAIEAGATHIGENYVQEATAIQAQLGKMADQVQWHMIGHLQTNKINKALPLFDVIQTVDSIQKAQAIDKRAESAGKDCIPVYLEVNIGSETSKHGISPGEHESFQSYLENLVQEMSQLSHVRLEGLMTMGPLFGDPEESRPYFQQTKALFDMIKSLSIPGVEMKYLSMGMTHSYQVAIEEGANMIRIGSGVFGDRE